MAWTATVTNKEILAGVLTVTVQYSDGTKTLTETYRCYGTPDAEWIEKTAKARIDQLSGVDSGLASVKTGTVAAPTPEVTDQNLIKFKANIRKAEKVADLISIGALAKTDTQVQALATEIKNQIATYWDSLV